VHNLYGYDGRLFHFSWFVFIKCGILLKIMMKKWLKIENLHNLGGYDGNLFKILIFVFIRSEFEFIL